MAEWDYELFWKETLNQLREELGEQEFTRWFTLVAYQSATENSVTLGVPSTFYREELKRRFQAAIESKLALVIGRDIELCFEIVAYIPPKAPLPAPATAPAPAAPLPPIPVAAPIVQKRKSRHPQLKLDYNFDAYVIGDNNSFAANAAMAISRNPGTAYNPFFLFGGVGLGKTHLMQAIGNYIFDHVDSKIIYISAESFLNEYVQAIGEKKMPAFKNKFRYVDVLLIDDIHFLQDKFGVQEELFHTFNALYDADKQIVFTCDRPASELKKIEDRLRSRFERGLNVDLQPPNYETRYAILKKKVELKGIAIPDEVLSLIGKSVSSNVRDLEAALTKLIAYTTLAGKSATLEIARQQLKGAFTLPKQAAPKQSNLSINDIQHIVASHYQISIADLKSKKRAKNIMLPRQLAIYIANETTEYSITEIGQAFGGRDHTTAIHSCNKVKEYLRTNPDLELTIRTLITMIQEYAAQTIPLS
jgi:chromosomal replication initiator protein